MTLSDIKRQLQNNQVQSYYIFTGDEIEVQRIYIRKIAEVLGGTIIRADTVSDIWGEISSPSMFSDPAVYVVRDDKDLLNNSDLQDRIDQGAIGDNILVHQLTVVDKRTKWYKDQADRIIVFDRLSTDMLIKYARKMVNMSDRNLRHLVEICENDYSRLLLEIDKIKYYSISNILLTDDQIFEKLVDEGVIYQPPADAIFDLVDAILKRQVNLVYDLLYQSYAVGEANMVILSVLYNNAKQVLQVQACESSDIGSVTGLTPFQIKCAKGRLGQYSISELVDMLRLIQKIQKGIITGEVEDSLSVEYLLVNIL